MRITSKRTLSAALALATLFAFTPRALRAGDEDDKKKQEKEWKKLEEKQKEKGGQKPGEGGEGKGPDGQGHGDPENPLGDNPLSKILDLMKEVETRLNDTGDADALTQEEQRKIVEAMKFEGKAQTALDDLIKKLEDMQNNQNSQGGGEQSEQQKKQSQQEQQKNETPEQKRQREQQEREKQQREKREEERRQRQNPQQQNQQKKPQDQQKSPKPQQKQSGKAPPPDQRSPLNPKDGDANRWGDLPAKLHSDAEKARSDKPPERWREEIEKYRETVGGE